MPEVAKARDAAKELHSSDCICWTMEPGDVQLLMEGGVYLLHLFPKDRVSALARALRTRGIQVHMRGYFIGWAKMPLATLHAALEAIGCKPDDFDDRFNWCQFSPGAGYLTPQPAKRPLRDSDLFHTGEIIAWPNRGQ